MVTGPEDAMGAPAGGHGRLRASDTDRDRVIDVLKAAFVQGRLVKDELDARAGRVFASRTYAELAAVTADIPPAGRPRDLLAPPPARPADLGAPARGRPMDLLAPEPPTGPAPARQAAAQAVMACAMAVVASEFFLVLAVFAFPVYGTLDIALLVNLVGLPLVGGMMLDTWRESRPREPGRPDVGPDGEPLPRRRPAPRGQRRAGRCPLAGRTARPTVIRVTARSGRAAAARRAGTPAPYSARRTTAGFRRP
jgi:hypothetical protein